MSRCTENLPENRRLRAPRKMSEIHGPDKGKNIHRVFAEIKEHGTGKNFRGYSGHLSLIPVYA
jgi:hypothetical protein